MSNGSLRILGGILLVVLGLVLIVVTLGGSLLLILVGVALLWLGYRARGAAGPVVSTQSWIAAQHSLLEQQRQAPAAPAYPAYFPPPPAPTAPGVVVNVASPSPTPVYMRCTHCQAIGNMLAGRCPSCGAPY